MAAKHLQRARRLVIRFTLAELAELERWRQLRLGNRIDPRGRYPRPRDRTLARLARNTLLETARAERRHTDQDPPSSPRHPQA